MTTLPNIDRTFEAAASPAHWAIDPAHTSVTFTVRHMMITNVRGELPDVRGEAHFDPARPEHAKVSVGIDAASIQTREAKRDEHLRSPDFFDVEKHPRITFESREVRQTRDGYALIGDLTIRGTTRQVTLDVSEVTAETSDPWGQQRIGASAKAKIRRSDFGMTFNTVLETGGVVVGDEVKIQVDVSLVKQ